MDPRATNRRFSVTAEDVGLAQQRARGKYLDFDPDKELHEHSQ